MEEILREPNNEFDRTKIDIGGIYDMQDSEIDDDDVVDIHKIEDDVGDNIENLEVKLGLSEELISKIGEMTQYLLDLIQHVTNQLYFCYPEMDNKQRMTFVGIWMIKLETHEDFISDVFDESSNEFCVIRDYKSNAKQQLVNVKEKREKYGVLIKTHCDVPSRCFVDVEEIKDVERQISGLKQTISTISRLAMESKRKEEKTKILNMRGWEWLYMMSGISEKLCLFLDEMNSKNQSFCIIF
jgi:flagellar biosynthesis chaperone FliJ